MPVLEFNDNKHEYKLDGVVVPSVTSIIKFLDDYSGVPQEIMEYTSNRGRAVHLATALDDQDNLDYATVDDAVFPYLDAWRSFRRDTGFKPTHIEQCVYSVKYKYAGTIDRIGTIGTNRRDTVKCLIDIKTCAVVMPSAGPQTAAYLTAANECLDLSSRAIIRYVVQLRNNGTYVLHRKPSMLDAGIFTSALRLHNWRMNNANKC